MSERSEFILSPSLEQLEKFKKDDLFTIAKELYIHCKRSWLKLTLKREIVRLLVDEDKLDEDALRAYSDEPGNNFELQIRLKEIEMQQADNAAKIELAKIESESRARIELAKLEVQKKELELKQTEENKLQVFDLSRQVRLVPPFNEDEVDKFFQHFEKVARNLKWPEDKWSLLLQSVIKGKAQEAFTALSIEDSADYQKVKIAILRSYELVPEAYRQRFRGLRKQDGQTYVEFAHDKEVFFDRWCTSKQVGEAFEKLRQLILMEEFKRGVHADIKTYLDEKDADSLSQMAVFADEYALTHKSSFNRSKYSTSYGKSNVDMGNVPKPHDLSKRQNFSKSDQSADKEKRKFSKATVPTCSYCKKKGHVMSDCWFLKKKNDSSPTGLVSSIKSFPRLPNIENEVHDEFTVKSNAVRVEYMPFVSEGKVSLESDETHSEPIRILRDTGATQSLLLKSALSFNESSATGEHVIAQGIECGFITVPLHRVVLKSDLVSGPVVVGVVPALPMKGVSMLLGNDLAGGKVIVEPKVVMEPIIESKIDKIEEEIPGLFPSCAVTRAQAKKSALKHDDSEDDLIDLSQTFIFPQNEMVSGDDAKDTQFESDDLVERAMTKGKLVIEQENDPDISPLLSRALSEDELKKVPKGYFFKQGVLMRKWRPPDVPASEDWSVRYQIVVPAVYRPDVVKLAHEGPVGGHLGINKTCDKIMRHFFWPGIRKDVSQFCKTCHTCQMVGKPNQSIPPAPLKPIPAFNEPFSRVIIDCVGPLPKTKTGHQYLLTIMCASTRFPEAVPLRNIKATTIIKALINFFTMVGLPKEVQSDQGSNFMSGLFQQVVYQLGATQIKSSAYHPESQGALERFHSTLKNMLRAYCFENGKEWDEGVNLVLFAVRESVQESLGFCPFELVFGHNVRGPLKLLKEKWLQNEPELVQMSDYVCKLRERLSKARELAHKNLRSSQTKMKEWYDTNTRERVFKVGDEVLVLSPKMENPLDIRYHGPYEIVKRVGDVDYVLKTPGRRKSTQLCHVNRLKPYYQRGEAKNVLVVASANSDPSECLDQGEEAPKKAIIT